MSDGSTQAVRDAEAAKASRKGAPRTPEDNDDPALEPATPVNPVEALIARMEVHNTEGEAIDAELTRLGLTRKKVNSILSTKARIAKEQLMLANLTGAGS